MKQLIVALGLMIAGCAANSTSSIPSQEVPPPEVVYREVPGTAVIENKAKIIGTYDNTRGFGNAGIEIKEVGGFRRWKSGLWDSSQDAKYRNATWTFQNGVLTLDYSEGASKKVQREMFDIVSFADRMFLVPVTKRESFIAEVREYEHSEASSGQRLVSLESLTGSYLSKAGKDD